MSSVHLNVAAILFLGIPMYGVLPHSIIPQCCHCTHVSEKIIREFANTDLATYFGSHLCVLSGVCVWEAVKLMLW